jgi:hypothetical protein
MKKEGLYWVSKIRRLRTRGNIKSSKNGCFLLVFNSSVINWYSIYKINEDHSNINMVYQHISPSHGPSSSSRNILNDGRLLIDTNLDIYYKYPTSQSI